MLTNSHSPANASPCKHTTTDSAAAQPSDGPTKALSAGGRKLDEFHREWRRKRMHMIPGLIPFVMCFVYHEDPLPLWNVAVAAAVIGGATLLAIKTMGDVRRDDDENWPRTCLAYAVPPLVALILFPGNAEFASVTVCVIAFGDSAAALAGRMYGLHPLPWNNGKTWMGLMSFVLLAAPIGSLAYWGEANPSVSAGHAVICGCAAAVPAAIVESLRLRMNDNLRIGFAALAGVVAANWVLVGAA